MASDRGFVEHVVDQIGLGRELVHKRMFGEWGLWLDGKIVALICDDQLLLKPTPVGTTLLGGSPPMVPPYPGAKSWLLIEDLDDGQALGKLLRATAEALPAPKAKPAQGKGRKR